MLAAAAAPRCITSCDPRTLFSLSLFRPFSSHFTSSHFSSRPAAGRSSSSSSWLTGGRRRGSGNDESLSPHSTAAYVPPASRSDPACPSVSWTETLRQNNGSSAQLCPARLECARDDESAANWPMDCSATGRSRQQANCMTACVKIRRHYIEQGFARVIDRLCTAGDECPSLAIYSLIAEATKNCTSSSLHYVIAGIIASEKLLNAYWHKNAKLLLFYCGTIYLLCYSLTR